MPSIRWAEAGPSPRMVIREILKAQRRSALATALNAMESHKRTCSRCSDSDHEAIALKMSKELEDAIDAAIVHLGLES